MSRCKAPEVPRSEVYLDVRRSDEGRGKRRRWAFFTSPLFFLLFRQLPEEYVIALALFFNEVIDDLGDESLEKINLKLEREREKYEEEEDEEELEDEEDEDEED